jgi:hypothetical protein
MFTFEIPFTEAHAVSLHGVRRSRYTAARLRELARVAAKLRRVGWSVWFTVTGLGFEPPVDMRPGEDEREDEDFYRYEERVEEGLARLGIEEDFSPFASKTAAELPTCWLRPF